MLADKESRQVVYSEEYMPKKWYRTICQATGVYPTIDVMATKENTKCDEFVEFFSSSESKTKYRNFLAVKDLDQHKTGYCFPPKKILSKALAHIYENFRHMTWLIIYHKFLELPLGVERFLRHKNTVHFELPTSFFTIIPSENRIEIDGDVYIGMKNKWAKSTHVLIYRSE